MPDVLGRAWKREDGAPEGQTRRAAPEAAVDAAAFMSTPEALFRMAFSMPTPSGTAL